LFAKHLEHSHFVWPTPGGAEIRLSHAQLMARVEGLDWKRVRAMEVQAPQSAGRCGKPTESNGAARPSSTNALWLEA
jgi:transposase